MAAALERHFRRRGLGREMVEDLVQEVAARALARGVGYESEDDLARWAAVVARNLAADLRRAGLRVLLVPGPPQAAAGFAEVEARAEQRLALAAVVAAWQRLGPEERARLAADLGQTPGATRAEQARIAVRRHRARRQLAALAWGGAGPGPSWGVVPSAGPAGADPSPLGVRPPPVPPPPP